MKVKINTKYALAARCSFCVKADDEYIDVDSIDVINMISALQEIARISEYTNSGENTSYIAKNILSVIEGKKRY